MHRQTHILIVDDHPTNVAVLEEILGEHYTLKTASCGEEALAIAPDFQPALILLDIMMPGIGGYETCRQLRAHPTLRHTKIIMVSARALVSERLQGYEAGAHDYITKPFDEEELMAKVRVYLRLTSLEEVEQLTSNVLALLSHETRTPLNGMLPPLQMLPGSIANVSVAAMNKGSTIWIPASGYRLGSQAPQDSMTWGRNRVELPITSVDPENRVNFQFPVTAPSAAGSYKFSWRMVHELVTWFGATSAALTISVGSDSPLCQQLHAQDVSLASQLNDVRDELASLDRNDPSTRAAAARLAAQASALQQQISALEAQQLANGCAPG